MVAEPHPDRVGDVRAVRRAPLLAEVASDGEVVLLRLDDRECAPRVLQGTAAAIWHEIDGRRDARAISARLARRYRAPLATVRADVRTCLDELQRMGLVAQR